MPQYQKQWCWEPKHPFLSFFLLDTLNPSEIVSYKVWNPSVTRLVSSVQEIRAANSANDTVTTTTTTNNNNNNNNQQQQQ